MNASLKSGPDMITLTNIRRHVFGVETIQEFAKIIGKSTATVSRWERGSHSPTLVDCLKIHAVARQRGTPFDFRLFAEIPSPKFGENNSASEITGSAPAQ